jgi:hypothetical protein
MATSIGKLPSAITGGESITATGISLPDYTELDGYAVAYQFASGTPFSVSAVDAGEGNWSVTVSPATTLTFAPGRLQFAAFATKGTESHLVDEGAITVTASPMRVSSWSAVISALDAAILNYAATPQSSISVDGMTVSYRSMADLERLRAYALEQLGKDTGAPGVGRRMIVTRFCNA